MSKAEVETNDGFNELSTKVNFSISKTEFTSNCNSHIMLFRNGTHENDSKLSKFIWILKDQNKEFVTKFLKNLLDQNRAIFATSKS